MSEAELITALQYESDDTEERCPFCGSYDIIKGKKKRKCKCCGKIWRPKGNERD